MPVTINGSTGIAGVDGSASTPASQGTDTNTGVFYPAADTVAVSTGGTERMRVDSSGNVGIGTSSPSTKLQVNGGSATEIRAVSSGDLTTGAASLMRFGGSNSAISGYVGFGGTSSTFDVYNALNGAMTFSTNNTERARINSSGSFLVGKTSQDTTNGTGCEIRATGLVGVVAPSTLGDTYNYYNSTASAYRFYVNNAGTIYATSTTISAISDQRFKENVRDLDVGLDAIMALKPRKFDWKAGKGKDKKGDRGWIAQEFEQVFPDMIDTWKDPAPEGEEPYKAVNADLIPVLVKAIQEQQAQIEELKAKVTALESK